jgi:hypothetical protein
MAAIDLQAIGYIIMAGVVLALTAAAIQAAGWWSRSATRMQTERHLVSAIRSERPRDEARTRLEIRGVDGSDQRSYTGPSATEVL